MKKGIPHFGNPAYFDSCHDRAAEIDSAMTDFDSVRQQLQHSIKQLLPRFAGNSSSAPYHPAEREWRIFNRADLIAVFVALRSTLQGPLSWRCVSSIDRYVATRRHKRD